MIRTSATWAVAALLLATEATCYNRLSINQGVIVHLFEWPYEDIATECEQFLAPHGFAGIQISPPSANLILEGRPWYERYQPVSYNLTTRSGTEQQLADMLQRCNKVGVRVFADVVINHMTADTTDCRGTDGSTCGAAQRNYPGVPFTNEHFHLPYCPMNDFENTTQLWYCDLFGLHDLNQTHEYVREKIVDYLNNLTNLGMAGFRFDAARHINPSDLRGIYDRLNPLNTLHGFPPNTDPLVYQEVTEGKMATFDDYSSLGLVTDFLIGYNLGRSFQGMITLKGLKNFGPAWKLHPGNLSVSFIENHDSERYTFGGMLLNYQKPQNYKMAIAFLLGYGYSTPKVTSSYGFTNVSAGPPHDDNWNTLSPRPVNDTCMYGWLCQHRWRQVSNMVGFHNTVQGEEVGSWWDNGNNQIAFSRGSKGFIAFNLEDHSLNQTLQTNLPMGVYCDVISGSLSDGQCTGKNVTVSEDSKAQIIVNKFDANGQEDSFLAIHIKAMIPTNSSSHPSTNSSAHSWQPGMNTLLYSCLVVSVLHSPLLAT